MLVLVYEVLAEAFENRIGPTKPGLVWVNTLYWWLRRIYDIILFDKLTMSFKPIEIGLEPLKRDSLGILMVAVTL